MNSPSEAATPPAATSAQQNRRITCDWFRSPPTDYLNVSSVVYPRGSKVTLQELDDNNTLVDVLYYRCEGGKFFPRTRYKEGAAISLSVDGDDFKDANENSTNFDTIKIKSKALVDAIRPALTSTHFPIAEHMNERIVFVAPFSELFFAQGRILETLKHGGLGAAKDKLLRALVTVMKVVLRKTNHTVREMAAQRTIDYKHVWTLYPYGSFVVREVRRTPHLFQLAEAQVDFTINNVNTNPKEDQRYAYDFASYGFDGYNWGMFMDRFNVWKFEGQVTVSSLDYRPLKFEERHADPLIVKKAIERGRKSLEYQSYHHCHYIGKGHSINLREGPEIIEINGRVVVDCLQVRSHAPDMSPFPFHNEPRICPVPAKKQEIYSAIRSLYIKTDIRRPTSAEQEKRRQFYSAHDEYLMLLKPIVPGWSLDHNSWFWLQVSNLEPVQFEQDPMSRLVIDNERSMNLVNKLINTKIQNMTALKQQQQQQQSDTCIRRKNVLVHLSGGIGTGKSATAAAIAEHHQRPLIRINLGDLPVFPRDFKTDLSHILEFAQDWQAILVIDTVASIREGEKRRVTHDFARSLESFNGVGILLRRDTEQLVDDLVKLCQINLRLTPFTQQKREKIWQLLADEESKKHKLENGNDIPWLDNETIQKMSQWELSGHDIQNLFENVLSLQESSGGEPLKFEDIEDLKDITHQLREPVVGEGGTPK